jgi:hypothetical protein
MRPVNPLNGSPLPKLELPVATPDPEPHGTAMAEATNPLPPVGTVLKQEHLLFQPATIPPTPTAANNLESLVRSLAVVFGIRD